MEALILESAKMVRGTNGLTKVQLQFAQKVVNPNVKSSNSILGLINKTDERFNNQPKARKAWITGVKSEVEQQFGLDLSELQALGDVKELNIENPRLAELPETPLNLQVIETTELNEYEQAHPETHKRKGATGARIFHAGRPIVSRTTIVAGEANHVFLEADTEAPANVTANPMAMEANDLA